MHETATECDHRSAALIVVVSVLMMIGVVMVGSATASPGRSLFEPSFVRAPMGRQAMFAVGAFVVAWITARAAPTVLVSDIRRRRVVNTLLIVTMLALVAAWIGGFSDPRRGSHRWLRLAPIGIDLGFQPSELAKLAMVAFLASIMARRREDIRSLTKGFVPAVSLLGACVLLVGVADFGTSVLLAAVGVGVMIVAGCRPLHLFVAGAVGTCGMAGLVFAAPYRLARITAFGSHWIDPQGAGYQPLQSLTSIAAGGWLGLGLGSGVQKYGYLPEPHTDFVFSVICEETGVLGGFVVIALFCTLTWLGLRTMLAAATRFERLTAFGLTLLIGLQAVMNIAVATVVAPTTGISLPFVSAGGSGILALGAAVGVLIAIAGRGVSPNTRSPKDFRQSSV